MDYNAIHGPGLSNFPSSTTHRMPTISAAQAHEHLTCSPNRYISTGIRNLDALLLNKDSSDEDFIYGGVSRGQVTDIYGPSGVGKTSLAMQLTASVLHSGDRVIWVDTSHKISGPRLTQILMSNKHSPVPTQVAKSTAATVTSPLSPSSSSPRSLPILLSKFTHFTTPSLAHLIALISFPSGNHLSPDTSLMVIDSLSALTTIAFLRYSNASSNSRKSSTSNTISTRYATLQKLISSLQKLAATQNIAIVVISQCVTKIRPKYGAVLIPAINSSVWDQGLRCRIVLFRDWGWPNEDNERIDGVRIAKVIKAEGISVPKFKERVIGFRIIESGLIPLVLSKSNVTETNDVNATKNQNLSLLPQKRKTSPQLMEIADSDDDEDINRAEEYERAGHPPASSSRGSEGPLADKGEENRLEDKRDEKRYSTSDFDTEEFHEDVNINEKNRAKMEGITYNKIIIENSESDENP